MWISPQKPLCEPSSGTGLSDTQGKVCTHISINVGAKHRRPVRRLVLAVGWAINPRKQWIHIYSPWYCWTGRRAAFLGDFKCLHLVCRWQQWIWLFAPLRWHLVAAAELQIEGFGPLEEGLVFYDPLKGECLYFCSVLCTQIPACVCAPLPCHLILHSFQNKLLPCFKVERKTTSKPQQMQKQKYKVCSYESVLGQDCAQPGWDVTWSHPKTQSEYFTGMPRKAWWQEENTPSSSSASMISSSPTSPQIQGPQHLCQAAPPYGRGFKPNRFVLPWAVARWLFEAAQFSYCGVTVQSLCCQDKRGKAND